MQTLTDVQKNILVASIIGDGEITKIYPGSRRINNSYREHYGIKQKDYRIWKQSFLPDLLYITPKSNTLRSRSCKLFTSWFPLFYKNGEKRIPQRLIKQCSLPHFLAVLHMDDGSLSISRRINHRKKIIYLLPHIYLYLQNYRPSDLNILNKHIEQAFNVQLRLNNRKDGHGSILRTTSVQETLNFLDAIQSVTSTCPSMLYKTNWTYRFAIEKERYHLKYPDYQVLTSNRKRSKAYDEKEIAKLIKLKSNSFTDQQIANEIGRSYWSVVYKLADLRKNHLI